MILALLDDPQLAERSGQTLISAELARDYGITERNGRQPPSYRRVLGAPHSLHPARVI